MLTTDPISDMLTRIRNSIAVNKNIVLVPHSNIKESIIGLLKDNNFINNFEIDGKGIDKQIIITINTEETNPKINHIEKLSKPGRKVYSNVSNIPKIKQGRGIVIISTSKGMMTDQDAKKQGIGGELICSVY